MPVFNYLGDKLNDLVLGAQEWTPPEYVYFMLLTELPSSEDDGVELEFENGYERVEIENNLTESFTASENKSKTHSVEIAFPTPTGDQGTVVGIGIYDAATEGNGLLWAQLSSPVEILSGIPPVFPIGRLIFIAL